MPAAAAECGHAIGPAAIEVVDLLVERTHLVQLVGNALGHLGIEFRELIQHRLAANLKLSGLCLPFGDVLLVADFRVERAQPGQRRPQSIAGEFCGSNFGTDLRHVDRKGRIE